MALELTLSELNNLIHRLSVADHRRTKHCRTTAPAKEAEILKMLRAQKSNMDIKRALQTSDVVINRVKRANGLWGA